MAIEIKQQKEGITQLVIQGEMTIYTVREQKNILEDQLKACKELQIDLSGVDEIDSAGLQLLLLMKREAAEHLLKFSLVQHSQAVIEVLELLNLSKYFGDPIVLSANWNKS